MKVRKGVQSFPMSSDILNIQMTVHIGQVRMTIFEDYENDNDDWGQQVRTG